MSVKRKAKKIAALQPDMQHKSTAVASRQPLNPC